MNVHGQTVVANFIQNINLNYSSPVDVVIIGLLQLHGCNPKLLIFHIPDLLVHLNLDLQIILYDTSLGRGQSIPK